MLGCTLVVGLFVLIAVIGIRTAHRAPDRFGTVLAVGATAWIVGQAVLNLGAVVGVLPVTGVPLPFVSFGGTALVSTMVAAGVLVNVAAPGRGGRRPRRGPSGRAGGRTSGSVVSDARRVPVYAVVTGGGTGGHVTPALAIADALVARGHARSAIRFVGARRGLEARAVPAAGYDIELLTLDGIQRSLAPRDAVALRAFGAWRSCAHWCTACGPSARSGRRSWSASGATRRRRACSRRAWCGCRPSCTSRTRCPAW